MSLLTSFEMGSEGSVISNFVYVALVSFLMQAFCFAMRKRGIKTMPLKLLMKWSGVLAFTALLGLIMEWLMPSSPFFALFLISLILIFLLDSIWLRIGIEAFSSLMPRRFIYPREVETAWRPGKLFHALKAEIENSGFRKVLSLRADLPETNEVFELSNYFISSDSKTILCVNFAMARTEFATIIYLISKTAEGTFFISSTQNAPDGLIMPENVKRAIYPWTQSHSNLLKKHNKMLSQKTLENLPSPTLQSVWEFLLKIESWNIKQGILNPLSQTMDGGILTSDGKYKLWIDTLLISYFANPFK